MNTRAFLTTLACAVAISFAQIHAYAADSPPEDASVVQARDEFKRGSELAKKTEWAEALSAFERSQALHTHPITTFNVAICERALGNYTRARDAFARALNDGDKDLPESLKSESTANLAQIDAILAHVQVALEPADALVSIDGRPLRHDGDANGVPVLVAGVLAPGASATLPQAKVELVLNPGPHLISVSKPGYAAAVVTRSFSPGERSSLPLSLALLPATIHVSSSMADTVVTVSGADVGTAPVDVSRHAGTYRLVLKKAGFDPYESDVTVKPGEETNLRVTLQEEKIPITKKWWFWTSIAAVVAGGAILTYELARNPQPPAYNGGSTGWVVSPQALRW